MGLLQDFLNWLRPTNPIPPNPSGPQPKLDLTRLVDAINAQRAKFGRPALASDVRLNALAQGWATYMATYDAMTHGAFGTRISHVFPNTAAGEDIAEGQTTIEQVVASWMNSPPHRANILGNFNLIGVGEAVDQNGATFWCVDFVLASK